MPVDISFNPPRTRASLVFRHDPGNLLTGEIVAGLHAALDDLADLPHLRLVTIEGAGPDFSFGASIPEHVPDEIARVLPATHALLSALLDVPAATAAVVRGRCLGGGFELALACDFIVAAETATFGLPEIALGVFPPAASVLLPLRAGTSRATSAILAGEPRSAADWQAAGVVELLAPEADLRVVVDDWFARTFERRSAEALRQALRAVRVPLRDGLSRDLPKIEALYLQDLMRTEDAVEGVRAFLEKRTPQWKDK